MDTDIDAVFDAAIAATPIETPVTDVPAESPAPTEPPKADEEAKREVTPEEKKLENALAYRKKQEQRYRKEAENLRAEHANLAKELEQYKPKEVKPADGKPKEDDYATFGEYNEAVVEWVADKKLAAKQTEYDQRRAQEDEQRYIDERSPVVEKLAADTIKANPEIGEVLAEHEDTLNGVHPQLRRMLLEAENPVLAAYHLAKEGVLDNLSSMSLEDARVEFKLAQRVAKAAPQPATKVQSKAPAPLPTSRGSVVGEKSLTEKSGEELWAWVNNR